MQSLLFPDGLVDLVRNAWYSDRFWRNLVIGAACVTLSSKLVTSSVGYAADRMMTVPKPEVTSPKKDMVYLYTFPRAISKSVPSISPYAIKLETWLRMHNIEYLALETTVKSSQTSQFPYVIFNGEEYVNSDDIISVLSRHFHVDEREGLTDEQWAVSRAISKMTDESLSWTVFVPRYVDHPELYGRVFQSPANGPKFLVRRTQKMLQDYVGMRARFQGVGRLPRQQIYKTGKDDLRAISTYLGNKQYIMGNKPTKVDCTVFGHLSQIVYVDFPFTHKELLEAGCENIRPYMERIRTKYWPDWDQIVHTGHFN